MRIPIVGMSCASCVRRVEAALAGVEGVGATAVDLALGQAHVRYDPTRVTVGRLAEVVAEAGFSPGAPDVALELDDTPNLLPRAIVALLAGGLMMGFVDATLPQVLLLGLLGIATPIQLWAGWPFYVGAWRALRRRTVDMNTLVALATTVAWASSAFVSLFPDTALAAGFRTQIYYEPALMILGLVLIGRVLEQHARGRTWAALRALVRLQPQVARVIRDGVELDVPIADVCVGELVRVRPGERVAVDGIIEDGASAVDESMVTGESIPVEKHPGGEVIAGTQNRNGSLVVRAIRVGHDATVARIVALVVEAQAAKAPIQRLADQVAAVFVPTIVALALLTFGLWALFGAEPGLSLGLRRAIAVLVVACPCALGLATPTAILVGVSASAAKGILVRSGRAFEVAQRIDTVVFDKT
ncbi:MAG: heavy metal translocating P-type ATPase, partial [Myxococcales bacterium]|nr:heavy metal translocating P-type ATPase [Myxococcales bacterium]